MPWQGWRRLEPGPPLAGLSEEYFIRQMSAYKTGAREHEMMQMFAAQTSEEETANLAAYYASLTKPCGAEFAVSSQSDDGSKAGDIEFVEFNSCKILIGSSIRYHDSG